MVYNSLRRRWPSYCVLCGGRAAGPLDLCDGCADELPWLECPCRQCGVALPTGSDSLCGNCLQQPPAFERCISPLNYLAPVSQLVARFKYGGKLSAGNLLSRLLAHHLETHHLLAGATAMARPELLVPMPLHWRRKWQRGFNQADIVADVLSRRLMIPLAPRALRRVRATGSQQSLPARTRRHNLRGAFLASARVTGRRVALIDDVVTTGATANEAAKALLGAGASSVHVWCLARTPP